MMHAWWKYIVEENKGPNDRDVWTKLIDTADEHASAMGGYDHDESYSDKAAFFAKYYYGFQFGRLEYYEPFIRGALAPESNTLSVSSGRGALECLLMEDGYSITCSDLALPACLEATRALFPRLNYIEYDVMSGPTETAYDAIMVFSLIFLFDKERLDAFFANMRASLKLGGQLFLDSSNCPDNWLTRFYHNTFLKWDSRAYRLGLRRKGLDYRIRTTHHGWFTTNREIVDAAARHGFQCRSREDTCFDITLRRSFYLGKYIGTKTPMGALLNVIGKKMPFLRLFNFIRSD